MDNSLPENDTNDRGFDNPLHTLINSQFPYDWRSGEYPPVDDIRSWFHLTLLCSNLGEHDNRPRIPQAVYAFRLGEFSSLAHTRSYLGTRVFFQMYGTTDPFQAATEQWLHTLARNYCSIGANGVLACFPNGTRPPLTKSHVDPKINTMLLDICNLYDSSAATFVELPSPGDSPRPDDVSISRTFVEGEIIEPIPARANKSAPLHVDSSRLLQMRNLPSSDESVTMGSGVSCGILGRGGMAVVYKIRNTVLEVTRAGKVLDIPSVCESEQQIQSLISRYEMEAKISAQLVHSNIVPVYLYDQFQGLPYLEMEFVDGLDLKHLINEVGPLPLGALTSIAILATRGIGHAHKQDYQLYGKTYTTVMHRDIKPANILLSTRKGDVKVTDFGIARPVEVSVGNTMGNNAVGTLPYMSPEQLRSGEVDTRTDIYSLGATLYEMASGRPLFPQGNVMDLLQARHANTYEPLNRTRGNLPKAFVALVEQTLKTSAKDRIQSAESIEECLEKIHRRVTAEKPEAVAQEYLLGLRNQPRHHATGAKRFSIASLLGR